jgi:capsular exopolysaccharide synthesis family protein
MGFFYQAIKRATGQPVEEAELEKQEAAPSSAPLRADAALPPALAATATATVAPPVQTPAPPRSRTLRNSFTLPRPIEKLIAFLTPPIIDDNIVAMEQCRVLRTRVMDVLKARKAKTLLITSAVPEEGKTVMSVNMAFALSQLEGTRVLLVDADLRKPSVANFLKMQPQAGLDTYLQGAAEFEDVCWQVNSNLAVCPTIAMTDKTAEGLHSSRMHQFLKEATAMFDIVVLDAAPLLPVADTQVLAPLLDAALLVVRAHQTPGEMVKQSADILGSKLVGTILNGGKRPAQNRYYTNYLGKSAKR